eukprot:588636_1
MGDLLSSSVQTFFPDTSDPYLVFIVRCQIVTETISMPLNLLLPPKKLTKGCISDKAIVILTYLLLIFGFIFSICQGLLENFALSNCANLINTYFEFIFYIGHRTLLLLIFLNRLFLVFSGSAYSYPMFLYYALLVLIIICGILSFISHSFNLAIMKVSSGWPLWNDDDNVCAWQFGPLVTHVTRPIDYALNVIILFLFLFKLAKLHYFIQKIREIERKTTYGSETNPTTSPGTDHEVSIATPTEHTSNTSPGAKKRRRRREHTDLEIVARRMSYLTFVAIISSVIVTGGYLGYSVRIISALWPFDLIVNSFCCVLMFKWTNFMIKPCFGNKCDRCCCVKCLSCCECVVVGCCEETDDQTKQSNQKHKDTI